MFYLIIKEKSLPLILPQHMLDFNAFIPKLIRTCQIRPGIYETSKEGFICFIKVLNSDSEMQNTIV